MNKLIKIKLLGSALLLVMALPAVAMEIEGLKLEETLKLEKHTLLLNGAGVRKKFGFKGFVGALYLERKTHLAEEALNESGAKRMSYIMLRDVSGKQMLDRINESIIANNTLDDMKLLEGRFQQMEQIFKEMGELKAGDAIFMDYLPGVGTRIILNSAVKGTIEGDEFYRSILRNWIGEKPVQASLKKAVLGQDN